MYLFIYTDNQAISTNIYKYLLISSNVQVSLTTLHNLEEYRLGFSAAIIHDLFNWCTVIYIIYT